MWKEATLPFRDKFQELNFKQPKNWNQVLFPLLGSIYVAVGVTHIHVSGYSIDGTSAAHSCLIYNVNGKMFYSAFRNVAKA